MPISQLLFFFVVLPIIYTALGVILISSIGSIMKQVKAAEYSARLYYERERAKDGMSIASRIRGDLAEVK
jgi:hypothetical protein